MLPRPPSTIQDVYVTRRVPRIVYEKRAQKVLGEHDSVYLYGCGGTISTVLLIVQHLIGQHPRIKVTLETKEIIISSTKCPLPAIRIHLSMISL